MLTVRAATVTHRGHIRDSNEDSTFVGDRFYAVADGMGGHAAGEIASALAVARLGELDGGMDLSIEALQAQIRLANADILTAARLDPNCAGMGSTIAGVCLTSIAGAYHWLVFNVGDSRVYRYVDGELNQLTLDHTEVAELLAAGRITAEQAADYPRRNVVTRALGADSAPEADVWIVPSVRGERFVICSDGLPVHVGDAELLAILEAAVDVHATADALVSRALDGGGRDNVTVIVLATGYEDPADTSDETVPRQGTPGSAR